MRSCLSAGRARASGSYGDCLGFDEESTWIAREWTGREACPTLRIESEITDIRAVKPVIRWKSGEEDFDVCVTGRRHGILEGDESRTAIWKHARE